MALIRSADVPSWHDAPGHDPDVAGPIGTRSLWPKDHTGTLVEVEDGYVVYQREIRLAVYAAEMRKLPPTVAERLGMPRMHAWLFMTLPPERDEPQTILQDYTLSFSALPHSQNRFFRARLRRFSHRSADEVNRWLVDALTRVASYPDPEQHLQAALDQLPFVPFQADSGRRGRTHGAWMVYPSHSDLLGQPRFEPSRDYTVGLCRDPDACRAQLHVDPIVQQHVEDTFDGTLFLNLPPKGSRVKGPVARPLSEEAFEKSPRALELAIDLSLAGLASRGISATSSKAPRVARQVALIYRDILYQWTKRDPKSYGPAVGGGPPTSTASENEWDRIDAVRPRLESYGEETAARGLSMLVAETEPADEEMIRLILACPDEWTLTPDLVTFLKESLPLLDEESSTLYFIVREKLGGAR